MSETPAIKRALVSGAGGFIGHALVAALESTGTEVHRAVRGVPRAGEVGIDLEQRLIDLSKLPNERLAGIDAVFHLAGEPITPARWSPAKRERIRASRVMTTHLLAHAIVQSTDEPLSFVCASAIGIYGHRANEVLDERSSLGTGFLAEVCRAWEAATAPAREAGHRVVSAESGVVLGPGGGALALQIPLFRAGLGGRLGSGEQWMSWIALDDEVAALLHLATEETISGPCNLTAPNPVTNARYTEVLARAVGRSPRLRVPRRAIELGLGRAAARSFVLASARVLPRRLEESGFRFSHPELDDTLGNAVAASSSLLHRRR